MIPDPRFLNPMHRRVLLLPLAAAVIAGACWYKISRTYEDGGDGRARTLRCPAPPFPERRDKRLLNQDNKPVRLKAYLGRHRILVVFYDGVKGAEADPLLVRLRRDYDRLKSRGVIVLGISTATPQQNRPPAKDSPYRPPNAPQEAFPFDLLTDMGPDYRVHRAWGRLNAAGTGTVPGVFLIERNQTVACEEGRPLPLRDADAEVDRLLKK